MFSMMHNLIIFLKCPSGNISTIQIPYRENNTGQCFRSAEFQSNILITSEFYFIEFIIKLKLIIISNFKKISEFFAGSFQKHSCKELQ